MLFQLALVVFLAQAFSLVGNAKTCPSSVESLQKKLISHHIHKYPLTYGKDIDIVKIETVDCSNESSSHYVVYYNDFVCFDVSESERNLLKCNKVRCQSASTVSNAGSVEFDLAPSKSCQRLKN